MLYGLHLLNDQSILFNLFKYITFRAAGASVMAFIISLWLGPHIIRGLKKLKATAFNKREYADSIHDFYAKKDSIPTMGGVLVLVAITVALLLWGNLQNHFLLMAMATMLALGVVGFIDDVLKVRRGNATGLRSRVKLTAQIVIGLAVGWCIVYLPPHHIPR